MLHYNMALFLFLKLSYVAHPVLKCCMSRVHLVMKQLQASRYFFYSVGLDGLPQATLGLSKYGRI